MNKEDIIKYKKKINKKYEKEDNNYLKKYIKNFFIRSLIVVIIFLVVAIICKNNGQFKNIVYKNVYDTNLTFTTFKNFYDKYLGGISFLDNMVSDVKPVFNSTLEYSNASKYYDGVALDVTNNYLVPVIETGLVVYIGEKENYGNVIIIQGMDGVDIAYSNMQTTSVKLYDYIEKGDLLGEVEGNKLYLVYSKNGEILNYEEYLK